MSMDRRSSHFTRRSMLMFKLLPHKTSLRKSSRLMEEALEESEANVTDHGRLGFSRYTCERPTSTASSKTGSLSGLPRRLNRQILGQIKAAIQVCLSPCWFPDTVEGLVPLLLEDYSPVVQERAAKALADLSAEKENRLKVGHYPGTLLGLARLLSKSGGSSTANTHAAVAMRNLSTLDENVRMFVRYPETLTSLVGLLSKSDRYVLAKQEAVIALANLSFWPELGAMIMDALSGLVVIMQSFPGSPGLQEELTRTLANLARSQDNSLRILRCPGALAALVELAVTRGTSKITQENATRALAGLSCKENNARVIVQSYEFALVVETLVELLLQETNHTGGFAVQEMVALTLANLLITEETQLMVADFPNAIAGLVRALVEDDSPSLQAHAAVALGNLALVWDNRRKIVEFPNSLLYLGRLLLRNQNPGGQEHAAWALANLSLSDARSMLKIAEAPNTLEGLVGLLSHHGTYPLQEQAARALANLTYSHENWVRIVQVPNAVQGLVALLSIDGKSIIQQHVAKLFANVTCCEEIWTSSEFYDSGAVQSIVNLLSSGKGSPELKEYLAIALGNLALAPGGHPRIVGHQRIVHSQDALAGLVAMLFDCENHPVAQEHSAWALANLAHSHHSSKMKIARFPYALMALVRLLSKHENPRVQEQASRAIDGLADVPRNRMLIAKIPGALAGLYQLLPKVESPSVQEHAARALAKISGVGRNWRVVLEFPDALTGLVSLSDRNAAVEHKNMQYWGSHPLLHTEMQGEERGKISKRFGEPMFQA